MSEEKRMIGDYSVLNTMCVGHREIVICEDPKATANERYLCCYVENNSIFERYTDGMVSDDYAEIAKLFGERITAAAVEILKECEREAEQVGDNPELVQSDCEPVSWEDSIENKVVVIKGDILRPEFRRATRQLMLCSGGFGAQANARGRTCFCISLFDGRQTSYYRSDILGVIAPEKLPQWAQTGLETARNIHEQTKEISKKEGEE